MTTNVLLRAEDLACERDERLLFSGLSFAVGRGEAWRVEGPNGAGKTTLLRLLAGLNRLYEGRVCCAGRVAWVGHRAGLKGVLTARENLAWYVGLQGRADVDPDAALSRLGLRGFEDQPCEQLSAGQQKRVALARLLLDPAPIWVLDEPFAALDVQGVALLEQICVAHLQHGGALIFSTHQESAGIPLSGNIAIQGTGTICE